MTSTALPQPQTPANPQDRPANEPPLLDSAQLLGGRKQVAISHGGELYSLRLTRNGKLILTK